MPIGIKCEANAIPSEQSKFISKQQCKVFIQKQQRVDLMNSLHDRPFWFVACHCALTGTLAELQQLHIKCVHCAGASGELLACTASANMAEEPASTQYMLHHLVHADVTSNVVKFKLPCPAVAAGRVG